MTTQEINKNFIKAIDTWSEVLDNYTDTLFALKPNEESWALGQVCQHLISSTRRVFIVINKCLASNANEFEHKTEAGEKAFASNILSEVKVKVPISIQAIPMQPENRKVVKEEFEELKKIFGTLAVIINNSSSNGKEKHPVLGFLNAKEWLQTVEMHFRHHLKQKEDIDGFLKSFTAK